MSILRPIRRQLRVVLAAGLIIPLALGVSVPIAATADSVGTESAPTEQTLTEEPTDGTSVPDEDRDVTLGDGWESKIDIALTTSGDSGGFHILIARMSEGYRWQQLATLGREGFDTDRWIGNACMTADQKWIAVTYAPRTFTNDEVLFSRGAFAAVVNVESGAITEIDGSYSLAYFNPGCGESDLFALAQYSEDGLTRISTFAASDPIAPATVEVEQIVTSIVPTSEGPRGIIGRSIVDIGDDGEPTTLVEADGLAFDLAISADGSMAYLQHDGERSQAMYQGADSADAAPRELASGRLEAIGLSSDAAGTLYVTGSPDVVTEDVPADVSVATGSDTHSQPSSSGELLVNSTSSNTDQSGDAPSVPVTDEVVAITGTIVGTDEAVTFSVPTVEQMTTGLGSPETEAQNRGITSESSTSPISSGSKCSVARNDPALQAIQPRPAEVEWAVNQGVRQTLHSSFPLPSLSGGGRVPAQVILGILAQESNFWQASKFVVPGVTGNPLVGNYYGIDRGSSSANAWWQIDYADADCGYGIAQVTTGMESGQMPYSQQVEIAVDYKANIARGLQILIEKWNENYAAGLIINDGNPKYLENWFYALWTYNTGFKTVNAGGRWGVGWLNNPINQIYPANRLPFLDGNPGDAAHPQDWPYPEKVIGFAAHSVQFLDSVSTTDLGFSYNYAPAFKPSWWNSSDGHGGVDYRYNVKPPIDLFCDTSNECSPTNTSSPCDRSDYECWFHEPATWKSNCSDSCGYEFLEYSLGASKPQAASSFPANCTTSGLPAGALIVDSVPVGTAPIRPGCAPVPTTGSFQFNFPSGSSGKYPAKIDVHQLGAGFNGQFYFSHTRIEGTSAAGGGDLLFSGTWNLGQSLTNWTQIYVHMPSHGAWLQQAKYDIFTGTETVSRTVNQRNYADEWVSLGVLKLNGVPSITLSNSDVKYPEDLKAALNGIDDIAWDAVAFVPLAHKPTEFVVALGDSYSSGEGTSAAGGYDFFRGSDHNGGASPSVHRNACHRSPYSWPSQMALESISAVTLGGLAEDRDPRLDYQLLACAGAVTSNISPSSQGGSGQYLEVPQLDRGFLDDNTTIVTLTIGGNDIGFGPVILECIKQSIVLAPCAGTTSPNGESGSLADEMPKRLAALRGEVVKVLQEIHDKAKNAKILLLGYPKLFAGSAACVFVSDFNRVWLNEVADSLNQTLTAAAATAGSYVYYANPQYEFEGHGMCEPQPGITAIDITMTPGDVPQLVIPGTSLAAGASAQSIHPSRHGAWLYSAVAMDLNKASRVTVQAGITGGAATTYYSTFRLHSGGPASMSVSSFSACGGELRVGLRKNDGSNSGVSGQQHTDSLSWKSTPAMNNFKVTADGSYSLPTGWYALNARMVNTCSNSGQTWTGTLQW